MLIRFRQDVIALQKDERTTKRQPK